MIAQPMENIGGVGMICIMDLDHLEAPYGKCVVNEQTIHVQINQKAEDNPLVREACPV